MKLSLPARKMLNSILIISAVFIAAGVVICLIPNSLTAADIFTITAGILISSLICVIKVFMLEYQVRRISSMEQQNKARFFSMGQGLARFVLTGAGLIAAHFADVDRHLALYGAIAGAFAYNLSAYALKFADLDESDTKTNPKPEKDEKESNIYLDNNIDT